MRLTTLYIIAILCLIIRCSSPSHEKKFDHANAASDSSSVKQYVLTQKDLIPDSTFQNEHFRGLSFNKDKATIAGSKGTIIQFRFHLNDSVFKINNLGDNLHFRDAHYSGNQCIYMAIQNPSQIISTTSDAVIITYKNNDTTCFLDGMDFWKNEKGILFGDPMHGAHFILKTADEGGSWLRISTENIPAPIKNEAGFAASGTSIVCIGDGVGYIGWGGDEVRVFKTKDYGEHWTAQSTPMPQHQSGTGIYSMAFKDENNGVAVGGNWEFPDCDSSKIYTNDGGDTWHLSSGIQGYRSCVTHVKDNIYVATGTNGTDISTDGGASWKELDTLGFNAIQFIPVKEINIPGMKTLGIGIGNFGIIKRLELIEK